MSFLPTDILSNLSQLRMALNEIHTSGDDTMRMASVISFVNQLIKTTQESLNTENK